MERIMKEKHNKHKSNKKKKHKRTEQEKERKRRKSTDTSASSSDEWVEKTSKSNEREDWMAMTGIFKTYTKEDFKPKQDEKDKKRIDSYNPSTSSRELNPYWKNGTGLPETTEEFRKARPFMKPIDDNDYYSKSTNNRNFTKNDNHSKYDKNVSHSKSDYNTESYKDKVYNWKKEDNSGPSKLTTDKQKYDSTSHWRKGSENEVKLYVSSSSHTNEHQKLKSENINYLSNEEMNKLAAKIVKAEIMGDMQLVEKLKGKLEAAREYRKHNPEVTMEEDNKVMLISTSSTGNSRPLRRETGDHRDISGKRKAETYSLGQRTKYFGNDDKYNLAQMFQQEKYGNNYENDEQFAKIASKHKNPNDDLEDIFVDEISKNRDPKKDNEHEKQKAINEHLKMEKSLDGCEYCVDSRNMLKHLMVSCGNRVYLSLPGRKSMVSGQCIITTVQHTTCVTSADEDVWEEIMDYRKMLTNFFNSQNKDVVFFETAIKLHRFPHMVINCVPLPRDVGDMAAVYFKKALLECEVEWSMNKKVVDLKGKNIRKGVPKGLPYFWIDFGMEPGFAHVIEDQQLFPRNFAEEVIGGMLDLDHHLWKNPKREYGDVQLKKISDFLEEWKPFEASLKK